MTLRITINGLKSLHLFYKVDRIVYCEGGESLTIDDVVGGGGTVSTLDILFWSSMLLRDEQKLKVHFKSVGSKETIKSILDDVVRGNIHTIRVCRDRDHDNVLQAIGKSNYLLHTYRYSWENDVISLESLLEVVSTFVPKGELFDKLRFKLESFYYQLLSTILTWTEMDIALYVRRGTPLFERQKPISCVDCNSYPPELRNTALRQRLNGFGYSRGPRPVVRLSQKTVAENVFGKLLSKVMYHATAMLLKEILPNCKFSYEVFMRMIVDRARIIINSGRDSVLHTHYTAGSVALYAD